MREHSSPSCVDADNEALTDSDSLGGKLAEICKAEENRELELERHLWEN